MFELKKYEIEFDKKSNCAYYVKSANKAIYHLLQLFSHHMII